VLEESEFCHVVSFVKNSDFNFVEVNVARFHEVDKTTWASNNDVNAIAHCSDLSAVCNAAIDNSCAHTKGRCERGQNVANLVCKFACWDKN
jgi:hypothetical protein